MSGLKRYSVVPHGHTEVVKIDPDGRWCEHDITKKLYDQLISLRNAYANILASLDMPPEKSGIIINADAALRAARGEA